MEQHSTALKGNKGLDDGKALSAESWSVDSSLVDLYLTMNGLDLLVLNTDADAVSYDRLLRASRNQNRFKARPSLSMKTMPVSNVIVTLPAMKVVAVLHDTALQTRRVNVCRKDRHSSKLRMHAAP